MGFLPESKLQCKKAPTSTKKCGGACKLNLGCQRPYQKSYGSGALSVLFIGSSPSKVEDTDGVKMKGPASSMLKQLSRKAGIRIDECTKINAVRCYAPEDLTDNEINACRLFVDESIKEINPEVIIPMGSAAIKSVLAPEWGAKVGGFPRWVGFQIPSRRLNAWICPTYHPHWVLEKDDEVLVDILQEHLEDASCLLGTRPDNSWEPSTEVTVLMEPEKIIERLQYYRETGGTIAFDYETTGLKPDASHMEIVSNSVCYNGLETIAYLMDDTKVIDETRKLLEDPSTGKIATNMKFEHRWTQEKMGTTVQNWVWDTMLASHVQDCRREVNSVKFQAYLRYGIGDYNSHIHKYLTAKGSNECNNIRELDVGDLLLYNGMDSILEYHVAVDQMRECGIPWQESQYRRKKKKNKRSER